MSQKDMHPHHDDLHKMPFSIVVLVGFQSNRNELITSILHETTALPTSTIQSLNLD